MISKTAKISLCLMALGAMTSTNAQDRRGQSSANPEKIFQKLDLNADGELTMEEFSDKRQREHIRAEMMDEQFKAIDTDDSGSVSLEEFTSRKKLTKEERIQKRFDMMDANSNGTIEIEEYQAFVENSERRRPKNKKHRSKKDD